MKRLVILTPAYTIPNLFYLYKRGMSSKNMEKGKSILQYAQCRSGTFRSKTHFAPEYPLTRNPVRAKIAPMWNLPGNASLKPSPGGKVSKILDF